GQTAVYDMDAGADNWVRLNANLNLGGASGDMLLYVPDTLFVGGSYVYLYSKFGQNIAANDSYEQWAVLPVPPPPPLGSISGFAFEDANLNGILDVNEQLSGVRIYIDANHNGILDWTDSNLNGVWDPGEGEQWTTTGPDGQYLLSGLDAGAYDIRY